MSKRRADQEDSEPDIELSSTDSEDEEMNEEGEEDGEEMVNVDFDFFDFDPIDFHATKNFLRQMFGDDSIKFDISAFADLILSNSHVGTTIKTEGKESDPFSILSVVNLNENLSKQSFKTLVQYLFEKTSKTAEFSMTLRQLLSSASKFKTGWIVSERLINMPVETTPPMYKMLLEEIENSKNNKEPFEFDYFLVISKVYKLVASATDKALEEDQKKSKKSKKQGEEIPELDYFHYEDQVLEENSLFHGYFSYTNQSQETDSRRVFNDYGIEPKLSVILLTKDKLALAATQMAEKFPPY
ncbi:unnamed protein product [Kuraishia capsulata CBS 1993]|uniref:Protein BCP1 n=1 Tax=Kuraishia capsulata CBS 1993 TaxID=1382522 RepID=W6MXW1_9ASCO|nr:uncharacterized protein KUCA_T00005568001 [Kuraishia capsulata CBS 1993]CDK29575.1 unnamed protein product [Kuraishia capsulata CBS 1993]